MMESERQVTDGNVSFNETTVLHVESFATREANVRLSRLPHPPKEKWTQFCLKIIRLNRYVVGCSLNITYIVHLMTVCRITRL